MKSTAPHRSIKQIVLGKPRDIHDPHLFHKISLIAFLAWVGLGADGLSSSAYGPDEAYRAILDHPFLAIFLGLATAVTVVVISLAYSRLIEHFPAGGGGYVVATKLLGPSVGVISGCALLVDYVLTITTSMASAIDQIFSFIPPQYAYLKVAVECLLIVGLTLLNLRGVKESVAVVVPIFMLFIVTHAIGLVSILVIYGHRIPTLAHQFNHSLHHDISQLGLWAVFLIFMNSYSRGAGTYTGIEAVSNGVPIMREPRVATAKRTMLYMAASLAITAGGILFAYYLVGAQPEDGKTMNAVLFERLGFGQWFVVLSLIAEGGLLVVAAQTGFLDGPRVMANMALDGWLPGRFSALSERLTMHYGVMLIGVAAILSLFYTHGEVTTLVTMYSINVFVTFSLSQLGMVRFWKQKRAADQGSHRTMALHLAALTLCALILIMVVYEKFTAGGWITIVVTAALIGLCFLIRHHYRGVRARVAKLSEILDNLPGTAKPDLPHELDPQAPTAVLLVAGYSGLGVHALLAVMKTFPRHYKQVIFATVGVIDSGSFKGESEIHELEAQSAAGLASYIDLARRLGLPAAGRHQLGTDPVATAETLCAEIAEEFPRTVFFGGKLIFRTETWYNRILHNENAFAIQRRLQWRGLPMVVMPVRVAP
jgi:amino acid transporter